uniref:BEN domain-containing protein n=1 Tax=Magallana gigas TaxID=29159 RepID=A0A8W8M5X7_MAGGI|nr:uncharacterized protein LOC117683602 [Crassostrea gigas]
MPRRKLAGTNVEPSTPKWALVLFDWDGCTACVETNRFGNHHLNVGSQADLSYDGKIHLVEVLALEDTEYDLGIKDKAWGRGVRAKSIAATRDARELCRRGKFGGFLNIKEDSESEEEDSEVFKRRMSSKPCQKQRKQPKDQPRVVLSRLTENHHGLPSRELDRNTTGVLQKKAKKQTEQMDFQPFDVEADGRSLRILFQGAGETRKEAAVPNRTPCFTADLTSDQVDIIEQLVENNEENKSSCGSQTESVLVLSNEKELRSACEKARNVKLSRSKMNVWCTPFVKEIQCCQKLSYIQRTQAETNLKLNRILELIDTPPQEISGLSECLRQLQTPRPTSVPANEVAQETQQKRQPLSAIQLFERENCQGDPTPADLFPDRPEEAEEEYSDQSMPARLTDLDENSIPSSLDFAVTNNSILLSCPANATIIDVKSPKDIVPGNCEFVINKEVQQLARATACSAGNFLWSMTKLLFSEEEMMTKMNFNGKKGKAKMSPRRRHSLVHLYVDNYDRRADGFKQAINSVNNGLLAVYKKKNKD